MNKKQMKITVFILALLGATVIRHASPAAAQSTTDEVQFYNTLENSSVNPYTPDQSDTTDSYEPSATSTSGSGSSNPAEISGFRRQEEEGRLGEWGSPGTAISALEDFSLHNDTSAFYGPLDDANMYCQSDGYDDDDDDEGSGVGGGTAPSNCILANTIRYNAGQRVSNFNTFAPMAGVADTLNAQAYVGQVQNALTSPLAVEHATLNLTEPGIAFGVANAMSTANQATQLRYGADAAIYNRLAANPGNGEIIASAYESCIAYYRSQAASGTGGTSTGPLSWIEAQSRCLGGEVPNTNSFSSPNSSSGFDFTHDPNYNSSMDSVDDGTDNGSWSSATYQNGTVIYAVDYLFNNENTAANSSETGGSTSVQSPECDIVGDSSSGCSTSTTVPQLRDALHAMIGDVKFTMTYNSANPGQFIVKTHRLPPWDPSTAANQGTWDPGVSPYSPRDFYRNIVMDRYNDAHALLYLRCRYENHDLTGIDDSSGGGTSTAGGLLSDEPYRDGSGNVVVPTGTTGNFWLDVPAAERLLIHLSTRGFRMKPQFVEDLFNIFKAEQIQVLGNTSSASSSGTLLPCQVLDTSSTGPSNLILAVSGSSAGGGGTSSADATEARSLAVKSNARIRLVFALSEKVAFGQYMATLSKAEDFITTLTGGSYDSLVRQYLLNMLYNTAGSKDLRSVQHLNDQQILTSIIPVLEQEAALAAQTISQVQGSAGDAGSGRNAADND